MISGGIERDRGMKRFNKLQLFRMSLLSLLAFIMKIEIEGLDFLTFVCVICVTKYLTLRFF